MARKSGPTILQEELYPPSAEVGREEMDDSRLVDLDVDEESPFLRGQKRVSARRSSLPKKTVNRLLWAVVAAFLVCAASLFAAGLYHYGEHSWRFRVESASGMRFVPNRLKVEIHERTPVAFARVGPRMSLIDAGGTLMELTPKHKYSFPVILGMNPGEPLSTRAPRMKAYAEMVQDLDSGGARYSQDLSEVDLTDLEDVKVRVNDPAGDVLVHLGSSDYLRRYKTYVSHVQEWRQQFQKLESVDLRYDNQIIVNPDMERTAKQTPLNPAMAKAAAAAGVKPVSLLTRVGPNDRPVPKPAFELTQKKLESKTTAGVIKKAGGKAKASKTAAKPANASVGAKRPAPVEKTAMSTTGRKPSANVAATKQAEEEKKIRSRRLGASPKSPSHAGGQKPSPAIAKSQASSEPSD